jgi:hypothetical protein
MAGQGESLCATVTDLGDSPSSFETPGDRASDAREIALLK